MADLTITAANVAVEKEGATLISVTFGEATTAGQSVYRNSTDSKYYLTDADLSRQAAEVRGIVHTGGAADAVGLIVTSGPMDVGATLTAGQAYAASGTPGGIMPIDDWASGDWLSTLGVAEASDSLIVRPRAEGVQI